MSMISEQIEQLESVRNIIGYNPDENGMYRLKAEAMVEILDSAIDTIKTLSAKVADENMQRSSQYYNSGWIPCSERLPNNEELVLLCTKQGFIYAGYQIKSLSWNTTDGTWIPYAVVAWRPLPEPYKGD